MTRRRVGLALFGVAIIWALLWGIVISFYLDSLRNLTLAETKQTMWALNKPWYSLWGLGGLVIGALVAGIGLLLYTGAKASTVWKFGVGSFVAHFISISAGSIRHILLLFGIDGLSIFLLFIGILWLWAKERTSLDDKFASAANLRLYGYIFFVITAWFTCGIAIRPFIKAFAEVPPPTPIHVMILLLLGWLFLFLSHYKTCTQKE